MANPSPDEGVRAALEAEREACAKIADAAGLAARASVDRQDAKTAGGTALLTGYTFAATEAESIARAIRSRAALSTEPGAGAASALPSPLPSQGEPVAWRWREKAGSRDAEWRFEPIPPDPDDLRWNTVEPLYTAEALAAAEARADRAAKDAQVEIDNLRGELACTYEELVEHTGDSLDDARTKRIEELRRNILKETPHGER